MADAMRSHSLKFLFLTLLLGMGFFWFSLVDTSHGAQVTSRSDTLNNSNVSATSNQTIAFTTQDNLVSQVGLTASSNFAITFPAGFSLSTLTCDDVNLLIAGSATSFNTFSGDTRTNCLNTGTSWGVSIDPTNRVLLFTTPTSTNQYAWVATGTTLTVNVGSNATFQGTGSHWITNPSSGGTYTLTVGAAGSSSFLGSGDILVSINQSSQLSATVAESLTFNVTGMLATKPFVQGGSNSPLSGNTFSKIFSSPNTAGDLIVLGLTWFPSTLTVSSIVDTQGNSYVSVGPPVIMSGEAQQIWYAKNINGGANTVTTTMSGSFSQSSDMVMAEYSGVNTVSPLDVTSSNSGTNGSVADSGSKATNFSNELIYGYGSWNGIGGLSAGSGFTSHTFGVLSTQEDKAVGPIGTYSATSSIGGIPTFTWIMSMATFKLTDATQLPC